MKSLEISKAIIAAALKRDQFIQGHLINNYSVTLFRYVEGEPGEDKMVDEAIADIIQPMPLVEDVMFALEDLNVPRDRYEYEIDANPESRVALYPRRLWHVRFQVKPVIVMGNKKMVGLCKKYAKGNYWANGLNGRRIRKAESKMYAVGQEVHPTNNQYGKYQWWFITSYRSGGIGAYRLLRSDGVLTTANHLTIVEGD